MLRRGSAWLFMWAERRLYIPMLESKALWASAQERRSPPRTGIGASLSLHSQEAWRTGVPSFHRTRGAKTLTDCPELLKNALLDQDLRCEEINLDDWRSTATQRPIVRKATISVSHGKGYYSGDREKNKEAKQNQRNELTIKKFNQMLL